MMKRFSVVFLVVFSSCFLQKKITIGEQMSDLNSMGDSYDRSAPKCLRTFLRNADTGGMWSVVTTPVGAPPFTLVGDNPCVEFVTCGLYTFKYKITSACCKDSVLLNLRKCCVTGSSICE